MKLLKNTKHVNTHMHMLGVYYYRTSYIWCSMPYEYAAKQYTGYLSMRAVKICS